MSDVRCVLIEKALAQSFARAEVSPISLDLRKVKVAVGWKSVD